MPARKTSKPAKPKAGSKAKPAKRSTGKRTAGRTRPASRQKSQRKTRSKPIRRARPPTAAAMAMPSTLPSSPATHRLGDDLGIPRLSREPVSILVARTDIVAGTVRIRATAPAALRVARGQVVHVKHAYRLQEHSPEREEYRFLLRAKVAGQEPPAKLARLGDQWGVPEDISGYLQQEFTLTQPGRHVLEFEVGSEYCVMAWGGTTVQALERKDQSGTVEIVVG